MNSIKSNNDAKPPNIDGKIDNVDICNIFSEKFKKIFAIECNANSNIIFSDIDNSESFSFSKSDIVKGIAMLKTSIGMDSIHSNHLKLSTDMLTELLAQLFKSFVLHHFTPKSLIMGLINPTVKDKFGDLTDSGNYRAVMLSSVILKLFA